MDDVVISTIVTFFSMQQLFIGRNGALSCKVLVGDDFN
jgi:hypothetical protein